MLGLKFYKASELIVGQEVYCAFITAIEHPAGARGPVDPRNPEPSAGMLSFQGAPYVIARVKITGFEASSTYDIDGNLVTIQTALVRLLNPIGAGMTSNHYVIPEWLFDHIEYTEQTNPQKRPEPELPKEIKEMMQENHNTYGGEYA